MPLTPPDPNQWTWLDTFTRTFLGPDYTVAAELGSAVIDTGQLVTGPLNIMANSGPRITVTLVAARWAAQSTQVQVDHRWTLAPNSQAATFTPLTLLEIVGETKTLSWDQESLGWGTATLATASVAFTANTDYRTLLTVDPAQGRIQISRSGVGLVDVPLPADWAAGIGSGGTIRIGQATRTGGTDQARALVHWDNLAVRSGDETADLSTGGVSSGGVRLGGEWRFAAGAPDDLIGSDGDVWADTSGTGLIYQRQTGHYVQVTQLLGAPGPAGPQGPQGAQGAQGETGPAGQDGALTGQIAVPLLLGDATPEGGQTLTVTDGSGGLAGYTLLGVDGAPALVETSADGLVWDIAAYPVTLSAGLHLRITRTDDSGALTTLRAQVGAASP